MKQRNETARGGDDNVDDARILSSLLKKKFNLFGSRKNQLVFWSPGGHVFCFIL